MSAAVRVLVIALLVSGALAAPAVAGSGGELPDYTLTVWAAEKGLPPGDVFSLAQDADGFLWVGTPTALLRFDGAAFTPWSALSDVALPPGPVHALRVARDGSLWVGLGGGGGVVRISRDRVTRFTAADGAPPGANALLEDRDGAIWAAGRRGLFRYAAGRWTAIGKAEGYPQSEAFSLYEDRAGALWVGTASGVLRRTAAGFTMVDAAATGAQSIAEDHDGAMWVTDTTNMVMRLADHVVPRHDGSVRLPAGGWRLLADRSGQVWVAAFGGGVLRIGPAGAIAPRMERFQYEHRLAGSPRALLEDRDGNIWIGMRGGLVRLSTRAFDTSLQLEGLTHDGVRTTAVGSDGSVWVATGHSVNRFFGGIKTTYDVAQTLSLHTDSHGTLWASTTQGLRRFDGRQFVAVPGPPGVVWNQVMSLTTDSRDTMWLCSTLKGVMTWDGKTVSRFADAPDVTDRACQTLLHDDQDRVWIGFQSGGLALYEHGRVRALSERDGLTRGTVLAMIQDKAGAVWISTSGGVNRFQNGRFTSITQANAPLADIVPVLVADDDGYIWVGVNTGLGILRFHPREVDRIAETPAHQLEYAFYDDTDGLQQAPLTWQSGVGAVRAADGRLWVTSGPGVAIIDPRTLPRTRRPPAPHLESVVANGRRVHPDDHLRLPAGSSTLRVEYASVSLSSASKLRYRYRLEGFDNDWVYAGQRRDASYAGLGPGDYRFRVGVTDDGQWTEAGQWAFSVAPPVYLTRGFLMLAAFALVLLIAAAWGLRMRVVRQRYALVFAERARVSREIHDTLLQSLAAMSYELEAIATQVDESQTPVRDALRRLRREVGHSLRDARESILELRRDAMTTRDVADALRDFAGRTASTRNIAVDVSVSGRRPMQTPADVDLQLFRIGQEAIANAIRHGQASRIDIAIRYDDGRVVLTVADNGCGFVAEAADPGRETGEHLGLLTMRERAARLRGRVNVMSGPGAGTTIEAMIPVTVE